MKSLKERLSERRAEYEVLVRAEKVIQQYVNKLLTVVPECHVEIPIINKNSAYIHLAFNNAEEFESLYITRLSELFGVTWNRLIYNSAINHSSYIITDEGYHVNLIVTSRPSDSCRIIKIPTGKTVTVQRFVTVEEEACEYLLECPDE